jgi:hypothetical protein
MKIGVDLSKLDGKNSKLASIIDEIGESSTKTSEPCIFISHQKNDSLWGKFMATYIKNEGLNVYYDEFDKLLQDPSKREDPIEVTNVITNALLDATHMICLVSEKTKNSWWVPFEIGFAWNNQYIGPDNIKTVFKNDITKKPEFFYNLKDITTADQFDNFLKEITGRKVLNEYYKKVASHKINPLKAFLK